jgi:hypothetical protein
VIYGNSTTKREDTAGQAKEITEIDHLYVYCSLSAVDLQITVRTVGPGGAEQTVCKSR